MVCAFVDFLEKNSQTSSLKKIRVESGDFQATIKGNEKIEDGIEFMTGGFLQIEKMYPQNVKVIRKEN